MKGGKAVYIERELVKVTDESNAVKYYAVTDKTFDNMAITEAAYSYLEGKVPQFKLESLGTVLVEVEDDND